LSTTTLKEQWRDEPQHLKKKRGDEHLADDAPVAAHRRHEPAQIEDVG